MNMEADRVVCHWIV